jgi:hypothetical protein
MLNCAKEQLPSPESTATFSSLSMPAMAGQLSPAIVTVPSPPTLLVVKVYQSTWPVPGHAPGSVDDPVLLPAMGWPAHKALALAQSLFTGCAQSTAGTSNSRTKAMKGECGMDTFRVVPKVAARICS